MAAAAFPVEKIGSCVVITLNRGENRLNSGFLSSMNNALDAAESYDDATCMVITGEGKHFCLGLDLTVMMKMDPQEVKVLYESFQRLKARLLVFPLVTVAALNGHCYAGGALLAICCDYIVMRTGKGWFCFPEIHIKRVFPISGFELIRSKVPHSAQHEAVVLGRRYTAEEALASKIVQEICPMEQLREKAIAAALRLAGKDGLDRKVLSGIKHDLHRDAYKSLLGPFTFYSNL